ncbi:linear amide C-N hydrolase [uncultured Desulfosarcina sp.]|uniref:linear amide C-N hydrolase n=1 Tax=uncultured Desulfosarcina sp. TaxID=218289 RepID=UPI0029C73191|nr:linear amide C-N hydrolase [uncultured Desulfosarcina sp.]
MRNNIMSRSSAYLILFFIFIGALFFVNQAVACSRVVYNGPNGTIITGRNMDWKTKIPANLWLFPRGIERSGNAGSSSIKWKSKYGSVVVSSWDFAVSDGMNEKGLVGNLLWLAESKYPEFKKDGEQPGLAISLWLQYVLDTFVTVDEAVTALSKEDFVVTTFNIPGTQRMATLHLSLSDKKGDSAILEYIDGKLVVHHDTSYVVMTNSPIYEEQLSINAYWKDIPGTIMLPGTNRAADRFVRGSYYINSVPKTDKVEVAVPIVFSVIRNMSVPFGISTPDQPNISSTRWRTVADQKNLVFYFEDILNPSVVWLDLKKLDFSAKAKVKKLILEDHSYNYARESSKFLKETKPFEFAGIE